MSAGSGGGESRSNLGRMVPVVVDDEVFLGLVNHFESSFGSTKCGKRSGHLFKWNADFGRQRNDGECIDCIMNARNVEGYSAQRDALTLHAEFGFEVGGR